ncbi:outer membrane protein assembly factor BamE, partial [Klebsiella pneumoniae]|nr:outer membrane protein assembly factor BamE [Klebsiella pneumoniae]
MDIVGRLRIGMTREEVVAVLGKPDDVSLPSRRNRPPAIYKYGEIELYFASGDSETLYMAYT